MDIVILCERDSSMPNLIRPIGFIDKNIKIHDFDKINEFMSDGFKDKITETSLVLSKKSENKILNMNDMDYLLLVNIHIVYANNKAILSIFDALSVSYSEIKYEGKDAIRLALNESNSSDICKTLSENENIIMLENSNSSSLSDNNNTEETEEHQVDDKTTILSQLSENKIYRKPTAKEGFYIDSLKWNLLCRNVIRKTNTMIVGETGSGKTSIVELLAKRLNIPIHKYNMGAMRDAESSLLGTHRIKDGNSVFDYAKFVYDIQKPGIVLLDELSRPAPEVNNILFPVLDDSRQLIIPISGSGDEQVINVHPECMFIATANIGLEYTGTMAMDAALVNRFMTIELEYLTEQQERTILCAKTGISRDVAVGICDIFSDIRSMYSSGEISNTVSTRESIMIANLIKDGFEINDSLKLVLNPMFEKEQREIIKSVIFKRLGA